MHAQHVLTLTSAGTTRHYDTTSTLQGLCDGLVTAQVGSQKSMARDAKIPSKSTPAVAQAETRAAVREVVLSAERAGVGEAQAAGLAAEVRLWEGTWGGLRGGGQGHAGSLGRAKCACPVWEVCTMLMCCPRAALARQAGQRVFCPT